MASERAFNAALDMITMWKSRAKAVSAAASVIEKGDEYDDRNWHTEQPKQYPTPHERLLFRFRLNSGG
jgi:hypothetical protein